MNDSVKQCLEPLEANGASMPEIIGFFSDVSSLAHGDHLDQFLAKVESVESNGAVDKVNCSYATRTLAAFEAALINAKEKGQLTRHVNIADAATYLTGLSYGLASLVRAGAGADVVNSCVQMSLRILE